MATLQSSTFTVELNKDSENISRAARRLIFNADLLKAAKLYTGDIVILSNGDMSSTVRFLFTKFLYTPIQGFDRANLRWGWCGPRLIYLKPVSPPVNIETQFTSHRI